MTQQRFPSVAFWLKLFYEIYGIKQIHKDMIRVSNLIEVEYSEITYNCIFWFELWYCVLEQIIWLLFKREKEHMQIQQI